MQHIVLTSNKEEIFVKKIFAPLTLNSPFARGLKDDIALIDNLMITTDSICEGIHVKESTEGFKVGHKLLARNLSDIASKGGKPIGYTLSLFKTLNTSDAFITSFIEGLKNFNIPLIGGDFCKSLNSTFCANITIFANKTTIEVPSRSGSQEGDFVYLTDKIGRAFLGFNGILEFKEFYELPKPPINLMQQIVKNHKINSSIDVSDGFLKDIITLLNACNLGANISVNNILPSNFEKYTKNMLTFGDDYQVIFTSKEEIKMKEVLKIGELKKEKILTLMDVNDINFSEYGYSAW